ncbi:MAG TPA: glycosyltransferase [Chitinophagaceae bacterium]|nr:glycosyltransferase [Chitinophagaceae bacterium]
MNPRVSIIIPCYNQGHFLQDALASIQAINDRGLIEVIIVNDGSTDQFTNGYLQQLAGSGVQVIFQENKGLPVARNTGIAQAKGDYILPLDADNKIRPAYVSKSIAVLDKNPNVGVVYGDAEYFGAKKGVWKVGEFNLQRLMINNYIDACAMVRRSVLAEVGMYDEKGIGGLEDWDLWLRVAWKGYGFHYIPEVLFDYRVTDDSMSRKLNKSYEKRNYYLQYLNDKYPDRLGHQWITNYPVQRFKKSPFSFFVKLILISYFPGYYQRLLKKNKIVSGL